MVFGGGPNSGAGGTAEAVTGGFFGACTDVLTVAGAVSPNADRASFSPGGFDATFPRGQNCQVNPAAIRTSNRKMASLGFMTGIILYQVWRWRKQGRLFIFVF